MGTTKVEWGRRHERDERDTRVGGTPGMICYPTFLSFVCFIFILSLFVFSLSLSSC